MANTKSAKLKIEKDKKRTAGNRYWRSKLSTALKTFKAKKNHTKKDLSMLQKVIDKVASKGIIHKNKASRIKAKLLT
jgi:small subunit ribosomal protein S20